MIANEELYGSRNHRLYQKLLLAKMKLKLEESHVPVMYEARFGGILSDDQIGVRG